MSRHRTIPSGRSRAVALIAAGAFSVAGAASAAAVTWPVQPARIPASTADVAPAAVAAGPAGPVLAITDQPTRPQSSPQAVSLAVRALQIHAEQAGHMATQWQHARRESIRRAKAARARAARAQAAADQSQAAAQPQPQPQQITPAAAVTSGSAEQIAQAMLGSFGWSPSQFACLYPLWEGESGWSVTAENPGTGAYGIPQAMPGGKMASAGPDWQTDAATQIRWGLEYIQGTYGSPCGAWDHEEATGWY
ncbi:MAG TPA: lytic transglycosylase domain-containing protein [Streptosporangiaceae bacterium]|nr:lytic transglycosylase domain-containing protein [Streptosporangiaceae bacterium]